MGDIISVHLVFKWRQSFYNFYNIFSDAQHFTYPRNNQHRDQYIPRRWSTSVRITYRVPNVNQLQALACGYERAPHTILKLRTRPARVVGNLREAEIYRDVTGSHISIGIKHLMESKPPFGCNLDYSGLIYYSGKITFKVYGKCL